MRRSSIFYPLVVVTLGVSTGLGTTIFDNFDDGNDTSPAWVFIDLTNQGQGGLGSRGFGPDNKRYQLSGPATASIRPDFNLVDGEIRSEMTGWNPNVAAGTSMGILFRFTPANNSGYFLSIDADGSPALALIKFAPGGVPSTLKQGALPVTYDPAKNYILQVIAEGAEFTCRIYEKGAAANTLLDEFVATDSITPHTTGLTGLLVVNDEFPGNLESATAMFDNFFATDGNVRQPTLTNPAIVGEDFQLTFTTEPGRTYVVEYKDVITAPLWNELTTFAPKPAAGIETATAPLTTGNRFYQVRVVDDSP